MYESLGMKASTIALWNKGRKEIEGKNRGKMASSLNLMKQHPFIFSSNYNKDGKT